MRGLLPKLGLVVAIFSTINFSMGSQYFAHEVTLRAARAMVRHPVIVTANLKILGISEIKNVDDAWRVGHRLADIYNFYRYHIDSKKDLFTEMDNKRYFVGRLTGNLYRTLEDINPSISLVDLNNQLFKDHWFHESVEDTAFGWIGVTNIGSQQFVSIPHPDDPWNLAKDLAKLFFRLPDTEKQPLHS